jgi:AbiU2
MGTSVPTTQPEPLDIDKVLHGLFNEVISGTAHFNAAKRLAEAAKSHPVIMSASPSFFNLTTRAHLEAAQLCAARLFDTHDDCAGILWLLRQAKHRREEFSSRTTGELDEAIKQAERVCAAKESVLTALKHRRDRWLAHLDRKTIRDPEQFARDTKLTYPELEDLLASAADILNTIADLRGHAGFLIFGDDYDDLSHSVDLIEKGVQANAEELERRNRTVP